MTIEQHAEAAADAVFEAYTGCDPFSGDTVRDIIARHMQSAIDEALAEKMIGVLDNASNHVHEVDLLKERITQLEGLGPLIEKYIAETWRMFSIAEHSDEMIELNEQIKAILKGGAS